MSDKRNRRQFLGAIGSMGALTITGTAAAQRRSHGSQSKEQPAGVGSVDNEQGLPIAAQGESTHTFVPDGDYVVHRHRFESRDLAERYGDPVVVFEPERLPKERVPENLRDGGRTQVDAERVIGTFREHANAEDTILEEETEVQRVSGQHHLDDDIPLYHYESADATGERKAPINVAWDVSSVDDAQDHYYDDCNWIRNPIQPDIKRYIVTDDGIKSNDGRIQLSLAVETLHNIINPYYPPLPTDGWKQVDIRVYNFGDDPYPVVGQAHIDPADHNQDCKYLGIGCKDWKFNTARDTAIACWESESGNYSYTHSLSYEKDFDTHDGQIGLMY